ncbi:hypothetical protein BDW74DRAFT_163486 [Aspergillus multicolor]|uniref:uncharacterized protein n=1 Tax=Aspergillus multicolor TaxID=41759 RepID=UPI003CCDADD3
MHTMPRIFMYVLTISQTWPIQRPQHRRNRLYRRRRLIRPNAVLPLLPDHSARPQREQGVSDYEQFSLRDTCHWGS